MEKAVRGPGVDLRNRGRATKPPTPRVRGGGRRPDGRAVPCAPDVRAWPRRRKKNQDAFAMVVVVIGRLKRVSFCPGRADTAVKNRQSPAPWSTLPLLFLWDSHRGRVCKGGGTRISARRRARHWPLQTKPGGRPAGGLPVGTRCVPSFTTSCTPDWVRLGKPTWRRRAGEFDQLAGSCAPTLPRLVRSPSAPRPPSVAKFPRRLALVVELDLAGRRNDLRGWHTRRAAS